MIDTLMMAYTVEMVSVERVLTCIHKFTPFIPEEDFPYDSEEAIITWINKVRFISNTKDFSLWFTSSMSFAIASQL